jgi:hypothetical protein
MKILSRACAGVSFLFLFLVLGLTFGPLGAVVEPLARRYGGASVPSLRLGSVSGSLYSGLAVNGIELVSGDKTLLAVSRLTLRPSWDELLRGNLWLSEVGLQGLRADAENLSALAARYGNDNGGNEENSKYPIAARPIRITLRDIELRAPRFSASVAEGFLDRNGFAGLSADLNGLPVRLNGRLSFSPAALSLDASVGTGRASLTGRLAPLLDLRGDLTVKVRELLDAFPNLPDAAKKAIEGELAGRFEAAGTPQSLSAKGLLRLTGKIAGKDGEKIPLSIAAPWNCEDGFLVSRADLKSPLAGIALKISADLRPAGRAAASDRVFARGEAQNISPAYLSRVLPLGVALEGGSGQVDFWASADLTGKTAGKVFVRLPRLEADKKRLVDDLRVSALLAPDGSVAVDGVGEVFGAKISAEGGIDGIDMKGAPELRNPAMTFIARGLDSALLAAAIPALAPLAPSGSADVTVRVTSRPAATTHLIDRLAVGIEARSKALTLGGVQLDGLSASALYGNGARALVLEALTARIGKAALAFSGEMSPPSKGGAEDWGSAALRFDGGVKNLDPEELGALSAALGGQVRGLYDAEVSVRGTLASPRAEAALSESGSIEGQPSKGGARIASVPLSGPAGTGLRLSASYADGRVTIPETAVGTPGGSLAFRGEVEIPKGREPVLNLSGEANFDIGEFFRREESGQKKSKDTPVSGRLEGTLNISGPLSGAELSFLVRSDSVDVKLAGPETGTALRNLVLDVAGTTQDLEVRTVKAEIGEGSLSGKGGISFGRRGRFRVDMEAEGIDLRALLAQFGVNSGVGGLLDGSLTLRGTPRRPEFVVRTTSPLTIRETLVDGLTATFSSPVRGRFEMNAAARLGDLTLTLRGSMERSPNVWNYTVETGLMDVDRLVSAKMPSMKGRLGGQVRAVLTGRLGSGREAGGQGPNPVNIFLTLPVFEAARTRFSDVSLPIRVLGGRMTARGSGKLYGGWVSVSADVSMPDRRWNATLGIAGLDVGQAAAPFLPQGEIVGSADVNVKLRGNYGALMMLFADGDFHAGEGYIHKVDAFKLLAEDGRVGFEEVRGSFFWDGRDLWLNPGTQATARRGDPFYRYLSVSGPLGIPGKGLNLDFKGRFNINSLNTVLGALRGAFQLMTGTLAGGGGGQILRSTLGKLVGLPERDFQDVTFQLKGSWKELQLLNLKIDKSLEGYLPLKTTDEEEARKENEKKIRFNLRIPVGRGGGRDGEDPEEQVKRQFLDNLLNQVY